ncbi:hypothetical protein EON65_15140 [archaeon]|nr:MAG: hypothetical protein EON65_15140 [archaeon]
MYYEKVLKASRSSIWILNVQLSMMSCSFSMVSLFLSPSTCVSSI